MRKMFQIELPTLETSPDEKRSWHSFYSEKRDVSEEKWIKDIWNFLAAWTDDSEIIELKTSGSTSEPKMILVKKSSLLFSAQQTKDYFDFQKEEKWLLCLPAAFIGGQMILVRAILSGAEVWAVEPKIDFTDLKGNFDFASMIPMQVNNYLENASNLSFKNILIGGASIPVSLEKKLANANTSQFYASYGMTETISHIALRKVNGTDSSEYYTGFKNILLGTDARGCLTIYHKNYSENVLITNDLVEFDSHQRFRVLGREDSIINSGGLKIIPEEVERKISEIIPQRILLIGIEDEQTGEKPILLMEGENLDAVTLLVLQNHLADILEKNKRPKEIVFISNFIETENGKLDRRKTKEAYLKNLRTNL